MSDQATLREYARTFTFIPLDATEAVVALDIPWVQISFDVRREPFEFAVGTMRLAQAKEEGWAVCEPKTTEWVGYRDATVTPNRYKQAREYVLYEDGVLITLLATYESAREATSVKKGIGKTERPDQHGVVIARNSTEKLARSDSDDLNYLPSGCCAPFTSA
jgi:hypothetical protein